MGHVRQSAIGPTPAPPHDHATASARYADHRRAWRAEYLAWLAAGRPGAVIGGAAALIYHHHVVLLWGTYVALAACALADRAGREAASKALRRLADRIDREGPAAVRRSVEEGGGRR